MLFFGSFQTSLRSYGKVQRYVALTSFTSLLFSLICKS